MARRHTKTDLRIAACSGMLTTILFTSEQYRSLCNSLSWLNMLGRKPELPDLGAERLRACKEACCPVLALARTNAFREMRHWSAVWQTDPGIYINVSPSNHGVDSCLHQFVREDGTWSHY